LPTELASEIIFLMGKKRPEQLEALRKMKGDQAGDSTEGKASDAHLGWRSLLSTKDVSCLRKAYAIPDEVVIRIPGKKEGATPSIYNHEVVVYEAMFKARLSLSFPQLIRDLLTELNLAPIQVKPTGWVLLVLFCVLWKVTLGRDAHPSAKEFLSFYRPVNYGQGWIFQGHPQFIKVYDRWHPGDDYEQGFFFISSICWELSAKERYLDTPPTIPVVWGVPRKSRLRAPPILRESANGRRIIQTSLMLTISLPRRTWNVSWGTRWGKGHWGCEIPLQSVFPGKKISQRNHLFG
jgi:hypothetical protein